MPDLNGRDLVIESCVLVVERWRALLFSALPLAATVAFFVLVRMAGYQHQWVSYLSSPSLAVRFLADPSLWLLLGLVVFQWSWLAALVHGSSREAATYLFRASFWKHVVLLIPVVIVWQLLFAMKRVALILFSGLVVPSLGQSSTLMGFVVLSLLPDVLALWGLMRWYIPICHVVATGQMSGFWGVWRAGRAVNRMLLVLSVVLCMLTTAYSYLNGLIQMLFHSVHFLSSIIEMVLGLLLVAAVNAGLMQLYWQLRKTLSVDTGNNTNPSASLP